MRLWKSWIIAKHELALVKRRRGLLIGILALPAAVGGFLPTLIMVMLQRKPETVAVLPELLSSFAFFFVILATLLPMYISTNSIVGEKLEKSLEPLLATPTSEGEILFGKNIATLLATLSSLYVGAAIFVVVSDAVTHGTLGYYFYPNWTFAVALLVAAPSACIYSSGFGVFVSARSNSVQSAQTVGISSAIPLIVLYVMGEVDIVSLDSITNLSIIAACLLAADAFIFFLSTATFSREEILTKWRGGS